MKGMDVAVRLSSGAVEAAPATRHKRPWFVALVRRYVRRALARRFDGFFVDGVADVAGVAADRPVLFCANHVSWWDAFVLVLLDEALGTDGFALMDDANLARLPFFRLIGALPLDVDGGADTRRQLDDAVRALDRPRRALWIFPQGRQRAAHVRPLGFKPGLRLIASRARKHGAVVVPVAIAYPWRNAPTPSIVVRLGAPIDPSTTARDDLTALVEARVAALLDDGDGVIDAGGVPGATLVPSSTSNAEQGLGARVLAWFVGRSR
jgi:1-acyl-sn-glycerol-3-phosphate acyltransferase